MIRELIGCLHPDPWRDKAGFSEDIATAHEEIFAARSNSETIESTLNRWLQGRQPCIFGRAAATVGLISYCVLTPADLQDSDDHIKSVIQASRTEWTRHAFHGNKSGFVILAVSPEIAHAEPGIEVQRLAEHLCSLYLLTEAASDTVLLDDIFLEMPGERRTTWKWNTGVNYFCAQADKRWWQDHRIPGGMAFSVNSVGHLVKAARLAAAMKNAELAVDAPDEGWDASRIDSLEKALALAMRTIANASTAVSGRATELLPIESMKPQQCPYRIPSDLQHKNFCEYQGFYHTDYTLPTSYFLPNVERPADIQPYVLDFTYLFRSDVENPAFQTMGKGQQIRADSPIVQNEIIAYEKDGRRNPTIVAIDDEEALLKALKQDEP
jgi:hypothetical protein